MKRLGSFFDEIYGFDGMSSFLLFISVILNLVTGMWPSQAVNNFNLISYLPLLGCIFRVFSRNHERRAHENECFLKLARPLCENIIEKREEQAEAKTAFNELLHDHYHELGQAYAAKDFEAFEKVLSHGAD